MNYREDFEAYEQFCDDNNLDYTDDHWELFYEYEQDRLLEIADRMRHNDE